MTPDSGEPAPGGDRHLEASHFQSDWCRVTVASIGDAAMITDKVDRIPSLNSVAESSRGWTQQVAQDISLETVCKIVHDDTRCTVERPRILALLDGVIAGLATQTLLIAKGCTERPANDRAALNRSRPLSNRGEPVPYQQRAESFAKRHQPTAKRFGSRVNDADLSPARSQS